MMRMYVWVRNACDRMRDEAGLTAVEYGVFAAFIVLAISVVAFTVGPKLSKWIGDTLCQIMGGGTSGC